SKVLVICAHAETALDLDDALRVRSGIPATVFHEGMSIVERDRAAAFFADEEFGAQVMICSEIGSEGRNFQFAHHLVMFDLPAHPDLLEQRIGRLDRIGQRHTIQLHVPYLEGTAQEYLFQWYDQALNAFRATCPAGSALQHQFGASLLRQLDHPDPQQWQPLLTDAARTRSELEAELQRGRDRLLELHSRGHTGDAQKLIDAIEQQDNDFQLPIYMERLFDVFGIDSEDHSDNALVLRPSERMLDAGFPLGDDEGVTITYDRDTALSREDMQFITWEHPMLQGGMDLVLSSSMGNSAVALLKNKALKPGTMLLECLFVSEAIAPRQLQLQRYLPPTPVRVLLDVGGNDLAAKVAFETLDAQLERLPKHLASKIAKSQRDTVEQLLDRAEALADLQHAELVQQASERFTSELDEEIARLKALQQVNPLVRQSEIDALQSQREQGMEVQGQTKIRLAALRNIGVGRSDRRTRPPTQGAGLHPLQTQEVAQVICPGQSVAPAQLDQFIAVLRLEQQVAQQVTARASGGTTTAQKQPQRRRQRAPVTRRDHIQRFAGRYHHDVHMPQTGVPPVQCRVRRQEVEALQLFQVGFQVVDEGTVQQMAAQLCQRGWRWRLIGRRRGHRRRTAAGPVSNAYHQNPIGSKVQRRTQRRLLAHGPIAVPAAVQIDRREQQGNRRRGHQMVEPQPGLHTDPSVPPPGSDTVVALIEVHRARGMVVEGADRDRLQTPGLQPFLDATETHVPGEQRAQRAVVQQRRGIPTARAQKVGVHPAPGLGQQSRPVSAHPLVTAKAGPDRQHAVDRGMQTGRVRRQCQGIDRPGGGTGDDGKRIGRIRPGQLAQAGQHSHLIG